jgi:putative ABC transport system substrate-binding protein
MEQRAKGNRKQQSADKRRRRKPMRETFFRVVLCAMFFALCVSAQAQQPKKMPRIGILTPASGPSTPVFEAFRQGLRDLGYLEGKNISIEYRFAAGKSEQFPTLAQELVGEKVDIIVTDGGVASRAARQATATIPIVMTSVGDPVAIGLVASLARPGSNITGFSLLPASLTGKRLEILREAFQKVTHNAVLWDSATPGAKTVGLKQSEVAAQALAAFSHDGVKLRGCKPK